MIKTPSDLLRQVGSALGLALDNVNRFALEFRNASTLKFAWLVLLWFDHVRGYRLENAIHQTLHWLVGVRHTPFVLPNGLTPADYLLQIAPPEFDLDHQDFMCASQGVSRQVLTIWYELDKVLRDAIVAVATAYPSEHEDLLIDVDCLADVVWNDGIDTCPDGARWSTLLTPIKYAGGPQVQAALQKFCPNVERWSHQFWRRETYWETSRAIVVLENESAMREEAPALEPVSNPMEERNRWIYERLFDLTTTESEIVAELAIACAQNNWRQVNSPQALTSAARIYATRSKLPQPPSRKAGRPKK